MPFHDFKCPDGHITEKFFKTFSAAELAGDCIVCSSCAKEAKKIPSTPLGFGFYGDPNGYYKPSPTKRFNTKTVSRDKGNSFA